MNIPAVKDPEAPRVESGFRLKRVRAIQQQYTVLNREELEPGTPEDREMSIGWDWIPRDLNNFEVMLAIEVRGNQAAADSANVMLVGEFRVIRGVGPSTSVIGFIQHSAVAILVPYAREAIASLTSRGLGTFHLPALNVTALLRSRPFADATGFAQLQDDPALAEAYGLERGETANAGT